MGWGGDGGRDFDYSNLRHRGLLFLGISCVTWLTRQGVEVEERVAGGSCQRWFCSNNIGYTSFIQYAVNGFVVFGFISIVDSAYTGTAASGCSIYHFNPLYMSSP